MKTLRHYVFWFIILLNIQLFGVCYYFHNGMIPARDSEYSIPAMCTLEIAILTWVFIIFNHYFIGLDLEDLVSHGDGSALIVLYGFSVYTTLRVVVLLYETLFVYNAHSCVLVVGVFFLIFNIATWVLMLIPPVIIFFKKNK